MPQGIKSRKDLFCEKSQGTYFAIEKDRKGPILQKKQIIKDNFFPQKSLFRQFGRFTGDPRIIVVKN